MQDAQTATCKSCSVLTFDNATTTGFDTNQFDFCFGDWIDAPGGNRGEWEFRTISNGEQVTIHHDAEHPSSIVFSTILVVLVFVPLFALEGIEGKLFTPLGIAYIALPEFDLLHYRARQAAALAKATKQEESAKALEGVAKLLKKEDAPAKGDLAAIADCLKERSKTLVEMADGAAFFFADPTSYEAKAAAKNLNRDTAPILARTRAELASLKTPWTAAAVHAALERVVAELGVGLGKVAQPVRVAVAGGGVSPPIDATLAILGAGVSLRRIDRAIAHAEAG